MQKTRKHLLCLAIFTALGATLCVSAQAQLQLEIAKAPEEAPKIAIIPFLNDATIYTIVENDLNHSGKFTSSSKNLAATASLNQPNAAAWQTAGVPYVVTGEVKTNPNGGYDVQYQLYDVQKQQYLLNEVLNVPASRIRAAAHMISDAIYEALTGIKGDFSGRIAYVLRNPATPAERYTLQIADTDGEQPRTILTSRDPILSPTWTPDAKKIAYVSFETKRPAIYLQDLATGQREKLASFRGLNGAPSFSPDGKKMLFTASMNGNPEIYQMDLQSRELKRLTHDSSIDTEARYMPDGQSFIFTSDRGGAPQIYQYDLNTESTKRLTFRGTFNARGAVSADGKKLALVHRSSGSNYKIAVQDLKSGVVNIITPTSLDESPSFSPNSQMVVYATQEGSRGLLSIVSLDGRFKMNLPSEQGEVREPAWAPK
ncbi:MULTISPECIES: Tol-Pal system beta propeller repeat protein TolB [unclassified Acinetobacter]|uniref:Tol-Pal system beta propeller repeat protein TolB n=1 Tax=unclassified Acinetobacter TaxID=196816 RepID=UPI0029345564|nr:MULTISPECIES: Tol-Pal system beta propeller repeat protein TolB [unclassified Acinetobacter]WOE33093.1 Tol-Pal system beta propeller repeat protein TolB [Acinetobacter sp. SAAs470]WOE39920.1 Tol-Pal system beta propeller repeat protein TolB [Acinetobacter sp. SAAs474]